MWSTIKQDIDNTLNNSNVKKLNQRDQDTLLRLKRSFRKATRRSSSVTLKLASDTEVLRGFADAPRETSELAFSKSNMGDRWAYQLNVQYLNNPYLAESQQEDDVRFDGSFISGIFGNYSLSYGYIDKWWGPGWDTSLILSTNARPPPGFMLQRNYTDPFETKWLSWIGPWTINVFANVLDDVRHVNNAKFLGMSVSFKPFDSLEIGLRRTAQWGGNGRPESLSNLVNLFLGKDNCGSAGIDECGTGNSNEPGNQLGAIDLKWRLPIEFPMSVYVTFMGEDEAGYLPSRKAHLFGFSSEFNVADTMVKYYVEYSDTTGNFGEFNNIIYNHSIYQTGYRYNSRVMGSTYDSDSESIVLGGVLSVSADKKVSVKLSNTNLNVDDTGYQSINSRNRKFTLASANYKQLFSYGQLELFLNQYSDIIDENLRQDNETRLGASWKMNFH